MHRGKEAARLAKEAARLAKEAARLAKNAIDRFMTPAVGLTADQHHTLELLREDNAAAPPLFRASEYWIGLNEHFDRWFYKEGIGEVESQSYNRLFSTADPKSAKYYEYALWMLYSRVRERDREGVLDRVASTAAEDEKRGPLRFGDHLVSWDLLISIDTLYSIEEIGGPSPWRDHIVLADLGSGWGRIGHVLMTVNPSSTYLAVDLPEALVVAESYLPRQVPGVSVNRYAEVRELGELSHERFRGGGLWFCGTHDLPRFAPRSVDYLVNVASFQEMTRDQVTRYLEVADRIAREGVYLQEIWDARRHNLQDLAIGGIEEYDFPQRWERAFLRNASFTEKAFEAGFRIPS